MKTNYSLKRIEQLSASLSRLFYRKRDKHGLTVKELTLYNKLSVCIYSQKNKLPLAKRINE